MKEIFEIFKIFCSQIMSIVHSLACNVGSEYVKIEPEPFAFGAYAHVYKGKRKDKSGQIVAMKELKKKDISDKDFQKFFLRETDLLANINHPFCLKILNFSISPPTIITPLMEEGTLDDFLKKKDSSFTPTQKMCTLYAICSTMSAIHSIGIIHRDFKPSNVFMSKNGDLYDIVIADFGSSRKVDRNSELTTYPNVTPKFAAPETFEDRIYSNSIDVFSFGVTFYQYFCYETSFEDSKRITSYQFIERIKRGERFIKPPNMNDLQWTIYTKCTENNDIQRPTFQELAENFEKVKELWIEKTDEKIYLDYIERCKKIYNDFISSHPQISLKDEDSKDSLTHSMPLSRSARRKKSKNSMQINKPSASSPSLPTFQNSCKHIDYLADDK